MGLLTITAQWLRLGCVGFGGPPTHIALLRRLCVTQQAWIEGSEFEDALATANLLPGPASTQLTIYCAWRLRGALGGLLGGVCFIAPGLVLILALAAVLLSGHPPVWVLGAGAGAGAAVPAVALNAARGLAPASWERIGAQRGQRLRWVLYAAAGAVAAAVVGSWLVLVLVGCGLAEVLARRALPVARPERALSAVALHGAGLGGLVWVAVKVGALSYGGGFVIVPLMQHDAVSVYHWMSAAQFLNAVALGQVTPGPVVQTVAVVGYAAGGLWGGLLASVIAFTPSFVFVLLGGARFGRIRANRTAGAFLTGAGPAVVGAIAGAALPLGLALQRGWQVAVLAGALAWLLALRRGVVGGLLAAAAVGAALALAGIAP